MLIEIARAFKKSQPRRSARSCSSRSPPKSRGCSARATTRSSRSTRWPRRSPTSTWTRSTCGAGRATSPSSASARPTSTTTCATRPPSRAARIRPDAEPEKGFYYRSDHFNFAKAGVPALNPDSGVDFIGKPAGYGKEKRDEWTANGLPQAVGRGERLVGSRRRRRRRQAVLAVGYRVAQAGQLSGVEARQRVQGRRATGCSAASDALRLGRAPTRSTSRTTTRSGAVPVHDDRQLFEMLILEGAQAGLSWITILRKRPAYRRAFDRFDPRKVARYDGRKKTRAAPRSRHRPQSAQDRRRGHERPGVPRRAEGVRLVRRLRLAVRRRPAEGQPAGDDERRPGTDGGVRRAEQGPEEARLQVRRFDDLLRLHAGRRPGGRPRRRLLFAAVQRQRRALRPPSRGPAEAGPSVRSKRSARKSRRIRR